MDIIDKAQNLEEKQRQEALWKINLQKKETVKSKEYCIICKEYIPKERQQAIAGCQTCVDCQKEIES